MWMECIRTTFSETTFFDRGISHSSMLYELLILAIVEINERLIGAEFSIPTFICQGSNAEPPPEMTLALTTSALSNWLIGAWVGGEQSLNLSVSGFLRCSGLSEMLASTLDQDLGSKFRVMIFLSDWISFKPGMSYMGYGADELQSLGHHLANRVLDVIETKLKPANLEASRMKQDVLRALFLAIFGQYLIYIAGLLSFISDNEQLPLLKLRSPLQSCGCSDSLPTPAKYQSSQASAG